MNKPITDRHERAMKLLREIASLTGGQPFIWKNIPTEWNIKLQNNFGQIAEPADPSNQSRADELNYLKHDAPEKYIDTDRRADGTGQVTLTKEVLPQVQALEAQDKRILERCWDRCTACFGWIMENGLTCLTFILIVFGTGIFISIKLGCDTTKATELYKSLQSIIQP